MTGRTPWGVATLWVGGEVNSRPQFPYLEMRSCHTTPSVRLQWPLH